MHSDMQAALKHALDEILKMTPEELLAEADKVGSGDVYEFLIESGKFYISEQEQKK